MQSKNTEDVIEIDLQEIIMLLVHKAWLIALCGIIIAVMGLAISKFAITPMYQSTTKVYILNKKDDSAITYSDVQLGTQLTADYAQLIKGRDVLEQIIETCGMEDTYGSLSERVTVQTLTNTRIIAITVEDEDPVMAQFIANEIRKVAAEHIKNVMDIQAVNVAEEANLPTGPSSPNIMKWTAIGGLLGAFLCAMVLVIRFLMDDTIKTSEDIERYLGLSTLAMIPIIGQEDHRKGRGKRKTAREIRVEEIVPENEEDDDEEEESSQEQPQTKEDK